MVFEDSDCCTASPGGHRNSQARLQAGTPCPRQMFAQEKNHQIIENCVFHCKSIFGEKTLIFIENHCFSNGFAC